MDSVGSLDRVAAQIEADQQVHNPLEMLEPFMHGPETLSLRQVDRIWRVAVTQSARATVRAALGDATCAEWQDAWGRFEASLREQLARAIGNNAAPQTLQNVVDATRAEEAMPPFLENLRALETALLRLRTVLAFNWSDTDNAYRRQENRLSEMTSKPGGDPERRRTLAREIIAANGRYREVYSSKIEELLWEVTQRWARCEPLASFFPPNEWPEVQEWFNLARKTVHSRLAGVEMARIGLEMDVILPREIASGNIRLADVDGKKTEVLSEEATARMKGSAERMQELVQAIQEEDDGPRRALAATLLGESSSPKEIADPRIKEGPTLSERRYHPIQRSAWFRFGKVAWWSGLAIWILVVSLATQSGQSWLIASAIGVAVFVGIKSMTFFIVLGRTTLRERPGSGFVDLDEFEQDMIARGSLDGDLSVEFQELRRRYGRRIPAATLRGYVDQSLSKARDQKRVIIADADRQGTTISVDSLRRTLLASPDKSDEFVAHCDQVLLRLEVEHGPEIPVGVVSELAEAAEPK